MSESDIQVYSDYAEKHEAAYTSFARVHESKNPRPTKATVKRDTVSLLIILALTVVMVASVIVSSSRTVEEFGGPGFGTVAFVMIDAGVMVYAFFRARRNADENRLQKTVRWATGGMVFTLVIAIAANIDAVLKVHHIVLPDFVLVIVNLLVGISAPVLAYISSDILAVELMANDINRRKNDALYERACQEWLEGLNQSWNRSRKDWGVMIEKPVSNSLSNGIPLESSGMLPSRSTVGHKKAPDASKRIEQYFQENPLELDNGNAIQIADLLGVGKSSVYNYIKAHKPHDGS